MRGRDFVGRARTADIDLVELANERGYGMTALGAQSRAGTEHPVVALMLKGGAYVNVHTKKNSEGEIRGEITGH